MVHIEKIILREISLPLRERFQISSGGVQDRRVETRSFGNVPHIVGDLAVKKANTIFPCHVKDDARREGDAADGAGISGNCHF